MTKFWLPAIVALFSALAGAQTLTQSLLQPHETFVDGAGSPCSGCKLYSYAAGTTTPLATFSDAAGLVPNSNPVILDSAGGGLIRMGSSSYKFVLNDASDSLIWTVDQVIAGLPLSGGTLSGNLNIGGPIIGNFVTIGPHATPPLSWTFDTYSPATALASLGCPLTNTLAACVAALPPTGGAVSLQQGTYVSGLTSCISTPNVSIVGAGMPQYNSAETALTGGTIIQGSVSVCGASNFSISNLGIDVGSAWVAAGNVASEGLIMEGAATGNPSDPIVQGAQIRNVVSLGSSATAATHGILVEHYNGVDIRNVESRRHQHCFAFKSSRMTVDGVKFQGCSTDGIAIKGDGYTQLADISITNVMGRYDTTPGDTNGVQITATETTGTNKRVTLSNYTGYGLITDISLTNTSAVGAGALSNISLNAQNFYVINTSAGTTTIPTCILSSGNATIDAVQVNGLLCNINDAGQAVAPLSLDAALSNSTLSNLTFIGSGFASDVEGTVTINGVNDYGASTAQKTFFSQVSGSTVLYIYGWNSTRGNQPFGTNVGAVAYVLPSTRAVTSGDGTNVAFAGTVTATQLGAAITSSSDIYNVFTNAGTGAEFFSVHAPSFAAVQSVTNTGCWFAGTYGGADFKVVDCQTGGNPIPLKIEKGATDASLTIQAAGVANFTIPVNIAGGSNIVYRCLTAGAVLPIGTLTTNAAACGTTIDSGLRTR